MVGFFPFLSWGISFKLEIITAFILSMVNVIIGYFIVLKFLNADNTTVYKNVYGGMLLRMAFIISFSVYMINNQYLQPIPFVISLMLFYTIHQWTEISSWLKTIPSKKVQIS